MPDSGSPSRKALKVALLYALAAALWIAVSDPLAGRLADLPTLFTRISLVKGWAFVGVTAALLFWLLRRDYAELEQAATAARESEQVLKNVLETLPVGVWLLDGQGRIVFGNREGTRIWGGSHYVGVEEFGLYKGWWVSSGEPIVAGEWGAARAIRKGESSFNEEIEIEGFDGARRSILHSVAPLIDAKGEISGAVVVNQEITAQKVTQTALKTTEEFLSKLLDNAPAPIYVTTAAGKIRLVNKAWRELVGLESDQVVGRSVGQIYPPQIAAQYLENNRQVLEHQAVLTVQEFVDVAEGRRYFQSVKFPVLDPVEGELAIAGISLDITERKQLEEQLKIYQVQLLDLALELTLTEERERRQIATGLHDLIGQPLALARIQLGQLAAEGGSDECRQLAGAVRKLVEEAIRHVRTLIFDLSPPILYDLGLEAALRSLAERFSAQHGIAVDFADDGQVKPLAEGMRVLLFQAVRELLVNVVKHARANRAKVSIGREGRQVRVVIEDDGAGFHPESGARSGFGLFSIRERLSHLGGSMEISAGSGCGTRVVLTVPAATLPEEGAPP
jgi:PAS domain S-box-containing protein